MTEREQIIASAKLCEDYLFNEMMYNEAIKRQNYTKRSMIKFREDCLDYNMKKTAQIITIIAFIIAFFKYTNMWGLLSPFDSIITYGIVFLLLILSLLIYIFREIKCVKDYQQECKQIQGDIDSGTRAKPEFEQNLKKLKEKVYNKNICIIPDAYIRYATAIKNIVLNRRADTLSAVLNVLNNDLQNAALRQQLQQMQEDIAFEREMLNSEIERHNNAIRDAQQDIKNEIENWKNSRW